MFYPLEEVFARKEKIISVERARLEKRYRAPASIYDSIRRDWIDWSEFDDGIKRVKFVVVNEEYIQFYRRPNQQL